MKTKYYYNPIVRKTDSGLYYLDIYKTRRGKNIHIGSVDGDTWSMALRRTRSVVKLLNSGYINIKAL